MQKREQLELALKNRKKLKTLKSCLKWQKLTNLTNEEENKNVEVPFDAARALKKE